MKYLIMCEGPNELEIINMLLEHDKLIFTEDDLLNLVPFSYTEYLDTLAKLSSLKEKAVFHYALFSESGFNEKIIAEAKEQSALTLYDLGSIVNYRKN